MAIEGREEVGALSSMIMGRKTGLGQQRDEDAEDSDSDFMEVLNGEDCRPTSAASSSKDHERPKEEPKVKNDPGQIKKVRERASKTLGDMYKARAKLLSVQKRAKKKDDEESK
eukprot:402151-Lingulodinium_polyedra.AAC.1